MKLEKKNLIYYKNTVKQMITYISKFGTGEGTTIYLYHFIDKITNFVYPIMILNQEKNPWNENFYPSNLFIIGIDNPNIDYYNSDNNKNYHISASSIIDFSEFRKKIKESSLIIEFELKDTIYYLKDMPIIENTIDRNIGYIDKFKQFKSIKKLISLNDDKFTEIDSESIKLIHSELVEKTNSLIKTDKDETFLRLYYSIIPFLPDKLKYSRYIDIHENDIISVVYLKIFINSIIINNFYKYIDIDNFSKLNEKIKGK